MTSACKTRSDVRQERGKYIHIYVQFNSCYKRIKVPRLRNQGDFDPLRKIGLDCVDIKLRLVNDKKETSMRIVTTISSKQAVVSREIDERFPWKVLEAQCASALYKCKEVGTFQTITSS